MRRCECADRHASADAPLSVCIQFIGSSQWSRLHVHAANESAVSGLRHAAACWPSAAHISCSTEAAHCRQLCGKVMSELGRAGDAIMQRCVAGHCWCHVWPPTSLLVVPSNDNVQADGAAMTTAGVKRTRTQSLAARQLANSSSRPLHDFITTCHWRRVHECRR